MIRESMSDMRMRPVFLLAITLVFFLPMTGRAIENPIGPSTVVPSSVKSGLVKSANALDQSGNLVITGNVTAGRQFRGVVPYWSASEFAGRLGSTEIDPFLRSSAAADNSGIYTGTIRPYYSPSATVAMTRAGGELTQSAAGNVNDQFGGNQVPAAVTNTSQRQETFVPDTSEYNKMLNGPTSVTNEQLRKIIIYRADLYQRDGNLGTAKQMAQLQEELRRTEKKASEIEKKLLEKGESLRVDEQPGLVETAVPYESKKPAAKGEDKEVKPAGTYAEEQIDVYEQMKQQLETFSKGRKESQLQPEQRKTENIVGLKPDKNYPAGKDKGNGGSSEQKKASDIYSSAGDVKKVVVPHSSFASYSQDKFNEHIRAAEQYMKSGKYYWAADAYTLASVYKPDDPLAYAGKSHALFAAGEYMSSALFLARALEMFPEYARFKVDIVAMTGDRDKLENRVIDVEKWQQKSGSAELQFLLGYVYYQMGRLERAKEAVDQAADKMRGAKAVMALKKAVDDAVSGSGGQTAK